MKIPLLAVVLLGLAAAQTLAPGDGSRALWDSTFLKQRPAASKPAAKAPLVAAPGARSESLVGLTIWSLRRSRPADEPGARVLVHEEQRDQEWTSERVSPAQPLAEGQRVRFGIESARAGYLYVIDREEYADGASGPPALVFPTSRIRRGDNRVSPGTLIEIPDWQDKPPYLTLKRSRPDHVSEVLTILVSAEPIEGLNIGPQALKLSSEQVAAWERKWGGDVKRLDTLGGAGTPYTTAEKTAATGSHALTQEDPLPQTIYNVPAKANEPLLLRVPIRIGK